MDVDEINWLLPAAHSDAKWLELYVGQTVIIAIWHPANHNHERFNRELWEVSSPYCTQVLCEIHCWLVVALPLLFPLLPNIACTFPHQHHNVLPLNAFTKI